MGSLSLPAPLLHENGIRPIVGTPNHQPMSPDASGDDPFVRVTLELRQSTLVWLDGLREEMGLRSRGALVSQLLNELVQPSSDA
jgi:hypothetical protein